MIISLSELNIYDEFTIFGGVWHSLSAPKIYNPGIQYTILFSQETLCLTRELF